MGAVSIPGEPRQRNGRPGHFVYQLAEAVSHARHDADGGEVDGSRISFTAETAPCLVCGAPVPLRPWMRESKADLNAKAKARAAKSKRGGR